MQRKALIFILLSLFAVSVAPAYAENTSDYKPQDPTEWKEKRDAIKQEVRKERAEFKAEIREYKSERKAFVGSISAEMKAKMQASKDEFRAKIASLKDERKKLTAERVDTKLASTNQKHTDRMSDALVRLQEILNRLIDRTNEAKAAGKDTTAVETAINSAKTAIAAAETAVDAQKAKTYTAAVTDESTLGESFSTTFKQLKTDLEAVHEKVKAAKTAVKQVAVEIIKVEAGAVVTPTP
jgi:hypothetical protein